MSGGILFCATEAGSARNLAPVAALAAEQSQRVAVLTSAGCAHLWPKALPDVLVDVPDEQVPDILAAIAPVVIASGTTSRPATEQIVMAAAVARKIPTVAVVDERYGYRSRFSVTGTPLFPTAIALMDDGSLREAVAEGLPRARCHVTGSPSLANLLACARRYAQRPPPRPGFMPADGRAVVTFLPETMSDDYGSPEAPGPLGAYLGYTEDIVREHFMGALEALGCQSVMIEHVHPSATRTPDRVASRSVDHIVSRGADLWAVLWHSQFVVGMRSMALVESAVLGIPTLSYQPGLIVPDRCTAVLLGIVPGARERQKLNSWCHAAIETPRKVLTSIPVYAPADAAQRVLDLAVGIARDAHESVR